MALGKAYNTSLSICILILVFTIRATASSSSQPDSIEAMTNDSVKVALLLEMGNNCQDSTPNQAITYFHEALQISDRKTSEHFMSNSARCYNRLGIIYTIKGDVITAISYYEKSMAKFRALSEKFPDSTDYKQGMANIDANIGSIYYYQENYKKALSYWKNALKVIQELQLYYAEGLLMNNIGVIYKAIFNYGKALEYYQMALDIFKKEGYPKDVAMCYTNMGEAYSIIGQHDKAITLLNKSLKIKNKIGDKNGQEQCLFSLADAYFSLADFSLAIDYISRCLKIAKEINDKNSIRRAYETLSKIYAQQGNYKAAYFAHVSFKAMNDSVFNAENQNRLYEMEQKYESEKRAKELALLKEREKHQDTVKNFLIVAIILTSVIFIVITLSIVSKRRREKTIYEKDILLHQQEKQLMNNELERKELLAKELNQELEYKTKQLTTHALNIMQKNKMLKELQKSIETIAHSADSALKPELRNLKQQVKLSLKTDKDWDVFKMYFEQLNQDFFQQLLNQNPDLNNHELRQCALLKLNMNIKETAAVLNLSPNSIKSARYRLKKKLGLEPEDDLSDFINKLG